MADVTIYWRPMCGYCEELKAELTRRHIAFDDVDIWADRAQAAAVTQATGGDEIVPTVRVGSQMLVNPSADQVETALTGH